ncbi:hypothetical protein [Psychrobacillus sp. FSL H8-0510]|uniref:hypothetical protein n=1 Tax=Psychrobacillus sp. FSL H8-0510 TaxID=2921394 RepID=UPI0030F66D9D
MEFVLEKPAKKDKKGLFGILEVEHVPGKLHDHDLFGHFRNKEWSNKGTNYCDCGAVTSLTLTKEEHQIIKIFQDKGCMACGCNNIQQNFIETLASIKYFNDDHKFALVLIINSFQVRHFKDKVTNQYKPSHLYSTSEKFRITTNLATGKTYYVKGDQKNKQVRYVGKPGYEAMVHLIEFAKRLKQKSLTLQQEDIHQEFGKWMERLTSLLPDYALKERALEELAPFPKGSWNNISEKLAQCFLLLANPHLINTGRLIPASKFSKEKRDIAEGGNRIKLMQALFPALTGRSLSILESVNHTNLDTETDILTMISNKDQFRTICESLQKESSRYSDRNAQVMLVAPSYSKRLRMRFVKQFFRSQEDFDRKVTLLSKSRSINFIAREVNDSLGMYKQIIREIGVKETDLLLPKVEGHSIIEVHDLLASTHRKLRVKNKEIVYTKAEQDKLSGVYGDIYFTAAPDTHSLVDVGTYMSNCISSYGESAFKKSCYLVTGYKNNEPYVCIRFSSGMREIEEVKMRFNQLPNPQDEGVASILEYLGESGAIVKTHDLRKLEENQQGVA